MNAIGTVLALRQGPREGLCSYPNGIRVDQRIARVIAIVLETGAFRVWCAMSAHEAGKVCDKCIDCSLGRVTVRQRIGLSRLGKGDSK